MDARGRKQIVMDVTGRKQIVMDVRVRFFDKQKNEVEQIKLRNFPTDLGTADSMAATGGLKCLKWCFRKMDILSKNNNFTRVRIRPGD